MKTTESCKQHSVLYLDEDMKEYIHTITAEWLFAKNDDGDPRHWIKGEWFYGVRKHWKDSDNAMKSRTGYAPEKTRFLGYCKDKYAFRIVCPEVFNNVCGFAHDYPTHERK